MQAQDSLKDAFHNVTTSEESLEDAQNSYHQSVIAVQEAVNQAAEDQISRAEEVAQVVTNALGDEETAYNNLEGAVNKTSDAVANLQNLNNALNTNNLSKLTQGLQMADNGLGSLTMPGSSLMGHASGGVISTEGPYMGAEGNLPELVLPMTAPGQAASLLNTYMPEISGGATGAQGVSSAPSVSSSSGGSGGGFTIAEGAVQVSIEGVPGAGEVAGEVEEVVYNALNQIMIAAGAF